MDTEAINHKKEILKRLMGSVMGGAPGRNIHDLLSGIKNVISTYKNFAKEWDNISGVVQGKNPQVGAAPQAPRPSQVPRPPQNLQIPQPATSMRSPLPVTPRQGGAPQILPPPPPNNSLDDQWKGFKGGRGVGP